MSEESKARPNSWVDELSEVEKQEMIEKLKYLRKEYDSLESDTREGFFAYIRSLAGSYADVLINDKNETLKSIGSDIPAIREAALRLAESHWHMEDEVADQCEVLAQTDPNERVRAMAIGILGLSYRDTKEMRIGRLLAEAVKNEKYSSQTRLDAYYWLVAVDGRHNHSVSRFKLTMSDINWSFVEGYLGSATSTI